MRSVYLQGSHSAIPQTGLGRHLNFSLKSKSCLLEFNVNAVDVCNTTFSVQTWLGGGHLETETHNSWSKERKNRGREGAILKSEGIDCSYIRGRHVMSWALARRWRLLQMHIRWSWHNAEATLDRAEAKQVIPWNSLYLNLLDIVHQPIHFGVTVCVATVPLSPASHRFDTVCLWTLDTFMDWDWTFILYFFLQRIQVPH